MAATSFSLKVFTPAGLVFESQVSSVYLKTLDGEIGILPDHTKYVGVLGAGQLKFTATASKDRVSSMQIDGGFCSFSAGVCSVLADSADLSTLQGDGASIAA